MPLRFQDLEVRTTEVGRHELGHATVSAREAKEALPRRQMNILVEIFSDRGYRFRDRMRHEDAAEKALKRSILLDWQDNARGRHG